MHLAPVPGTDLLLLNAMAQVICAEGLLDTAFIEKHVRFSDGQNTVDLAAFQAFLAQYTPEAVAAELVPACGCALELVADTGVKAPSTAIRQGSSVKTPCTPSRNSMSRSTPVLTV